MFRRFMAEHEKWEGTATQLLADLVAFVRRPVREAEAAHARAVKDKDDIAKEKTAAALREARETARDILGDHWPKAPNALTGKLKRASPALRNAGVRVDWPTTHGEAKIIKITTTAPKRRRQKSSSSSSPSNKTIRLNDLAQKSEDDSGRLADDAAPLKDGRGRDGPAEIRTIAGRAPPERSSSSTSLNSARNLASQTKQDVEDDLSPSLSGANGLDRRAYRLRLRQVRFPRRACERRLARDPGSSRASSATSIASAATHGGVWRARRCNRPVVARRRDDMSGRAARKRLAAVSLNGAGNLCDVAPSRFERFDQDEYFTIDAGWIIPALCCAVQVEGPILEPCAGRGHMVHELRALGFDVRAADLYAYRRYARIRHKDRRRHFRTQVARRLSLHRYEPPLPRTGRHPRPSPADRGPRWGQRGGSGALRVEFGRGSPRAHSRESAVRWRGAAYEAA